MKEKGFTLIELLAVIVILAIIALIATPIILNIINDAKKQSNQRSAELYLKAAELAIARENLNGELNASSCDVQSDGNLKCNGKDVKVDVDGEKPKSGKITFSNGKITKLESFKVGNTKYKLENGSLKVDDSTEEEAETFTGTIYRNSTETIKNGDSIVPQTKSVYCGIVSEDETSCDYGISWDSNSECVSGMASMDTPNATCNEETITTGLTSYETEDTKNNITTSFYIKHEVDKDIIQASYLCIRYTEYNEENEVCLMGGDPLYYGTYDGMSSSYIYDVSDKSPTGNIAIMNSIKHIFSQCHFSNERTYCTGKSDSLTTLSSYSDGGNVTANDVTLQCGVITGGSSFCMPVS